jgi:hypothetical protein
MRLVALGPMIRFWRDGRCVGDFDQSRTNRDHHAPRHDVGVIEYKLSCKCLADKNADQPAFENFVSRNVIDHAFRRIAIVFERLSNNPTHLPISPALHQRWYHRAAYEFLTRTILSEREDSLTRREVFQNEALSGRRYTQFPRAHLLSSLAPVASNPFFLSGDQ